MHARTRSGLATNIFGPRFDDGRVRCGDCYAGRLWRGILALVVIIGAVGGLIGLISGSTEQVIGGSAIATVGGAFAYRRVVVHDRASSRLTRP